MGISIADLKKRINQIPEVSEDSEESKEEEEEIVVKRESTDFEMRQVRDKNVILPFERYPHGILAI